MTNTAPKPRKENSAPKPHKERTVPKSRKEDSAPKHRKEDIAPKPRKEKWDMPVSRKFYTKLQQRVSSLHWNTDMPLTSLAILLDYMETYVMTRRAPDRYSADHYAYLIFVTIRPEIDDALRRSEACRERAAERRARKLAAMEACRAIMPGDCRAIACGGRPAAADTACGDHPSVSPDQSPVVAVGKNKTLVTPVPSRPLVPLISGSVTACDDPTTRKIACNNPTPRGIIEIAPYPGYDLRDGVYYRRPDTFLLNRAPSVWTPRPLPQNFVDL